jgi:hypothetical protein
MGPAIDNIDSDDNEEDLATIVKPTPLIQQINESKLKVTAHVVGIIKKFSKTYGGSILNMDQMTPAT